MNKGHFPHEDQTRRFAVPTPPDFADDLEFVEKNINAKLDIMVEAGVLPANSWTVLDPYYANRETGIVRRVRFVSFDQSVDDKALALTRVCLNNTYWDLFGNQKNRSIFVVRWASAPRKREDREGGEGHRGSGSGSGEKSSFYKRDGQKSYEKNYGDKPKAEAKVKLDHGKLETSTSMRSNSSTPAWKKGKKGKKGKEETD